MAAASHGDEKIALARETDGGPHVGGAGAAGDESGMTIDRTVPDRAGSVVLPVAGTDELSTEVSCKVSDGRVVESGGVATLGLESCWSNHRAPPRCPEDCSDRPTDKAQKLDLRRPPPFSTLGPG